jgi:hypothetical protein
MNKKYLTKTIVYFVLALVVMPVVWFFSGTLIGLFIQRDVFTNPQRVLTIAKYARYLHIGVAVLGLIFLGLGVYYLIKLLGDEENKD